ncbi:SHOCT domain-containing protein [Halobaculum limi]|uniref:SHOCT domain-containing protein n=1 Tax=Halobaculum limi TaxID=3031916 RepID=UPI0024071417|nr:SHOCT domain-containing protein [Halobaculum sp. YSMS11]
MSPPPDTDVHPTLARITPDTPRWRRRAAAVAALAAPLALYGSWAVVSGVKSGLVYNTIVLAFSLVALFAPAFAAASLLAPDSGSRSKQRDATDPVTTLQQRYASGGIDREEFDERLDAVLETTDDGRSASEQATSDQASHKRLERTRTDA